MFTICFLLNKNLKNAYKTLKLLFKVKHFLSVHHLLFESTISRDHFLSLMKFTKQIKVNVNTKILYKYSFKC